jgi:hypothetical protein
MSIQHVFLGGFLATLVLSTLSAAGQGLGLSRMSMPLLLGSVFTGDRRRATLIGFLLHIVAGWAFAGLYAVVFERFRLATWWLGALLGLGQALFVLVALMPIMPMLHPRMASEDRGPNPTRQLEPPGFLALYYGRGTPLVIIAAHLAYGATLGGIYVLSPS